MIGRPVALSVLTLSGFLVQPLLAAHGAQFEASGEVKIQSVLDGGMPSEHPTFHFHVYVSGCEWHIKVRKEVGGRRVDLQVGFDGQYRYTFGHDKGMIDHEEVPVYGPVPLLSAVWMAFCQSCYLDHNPTALIPAYQTGWLRTPLPATVTRRRDLARLPESIEYFNDGFRRDTEVAKWSPPFDVGFREAVYLASDFETVGTLELPRTFELTIFHPKPGALTAADTVPALVLVGTVTNLQAGCTLSTMVPRIIRSTESSEVWISDYRFIPVGAVGRMHFMYVADKWLSTNEVSVLEGFDSYQRSLPYMSQVSRSLTVTVTPASGRRVPVLVVLLVALGLTAGLWLILRQRIHDGRRKM
jgi:hypothetical protein